MLGLKPPFNIIHKYLMNDQANNGYIDSGRDLDKNPELQYPEYDSNSTLRDYDNVIKEQNGEQFKVNISGLQTPLKISHIKFFLGSFPIRNYDVSFGNLTNPTEQTIKSLFEERIINLPERYKIPSSVKYDHKYCFKKQDGKIIKCEVTLEVRYSNTSQPKTFINEFDIDSETGLLSHLTVQINYKPHYIKRESEVGSSNSVSQLHNSRRNNSVAENDPIINQSVINNHFANMPSTNDTNANSIFNKHNCLIFIGCAVGLIAAAVIAKYAYSKYGVSKIILPNAQHVIKSIPTISSSLDISSTAQLSL